MIKFIASFFSSSARVTRTVSLSKPYLMTTTHTNR